MFKKLFGYQHPKQTLQKCITTKTISASVFYRTSFVFVEFVSSDTLSVLDTKKKQLSITPFQEMFTYQQVPHIVENIQSIPLFERLLCKTLDVFLKISLIEKVLSGIDKRNLQINQHFNINIFRTNNLKVPLLIIITMRFCLFSQLPLTPNKLIINSRNDKSVFEPLIQIQVCKITLMLVGVRPNSEDIFMNHIWNTFQNTLTSTVWKD